MEPEPRTRDPCSQVSCSFGAECVSDGESRVQCRCPVMHCDDDEDRLVCGTDGREYDNECEMRMTSCREQRHIAKKYDGHCGQ